MWVAIGIGLVAVLVAIALVILVSRRDPDRPRTEMAGDEMFNLGIIFTGAGVALWVSAGPSMIGILALGVIFMLMGARKKREQ